MRRVRKHVDHARRHAAVARLVHQQARVARQRGRVAAHVHNALRRRPAPTLSGVLVKIRQRLGQRKSTFARRVHQPLLGSAVGDQQTRRHLEQVARGERRGRQRTVTPRLVQREVVTRARHQGLAALNAQHLTGGGGNGQREVAQPTKPVDHALGLLRIQQTQRTRHQDAVDGWIHLGEVGRLERHGDAEFGQGVGQQRTIGVQQLHRIRTLGLQPPLHTVLLCKRAQTADVVLAQRLQVAQHHGRHRVAASQFDLRAGFARVHAEDEFAQRHEHLAHMRRQHRADPHVGHVAALALVKADQHLALFVHMAHRQARAEAVAPGRPLDRAQHGLGPHLAQVPQVVFQHTLLHSHLGRFVQVLHLAAATSAGVQAEMRATGTHALRRLVVHRRHHTGLPVVLLAVHVDADLLERQGAFDEDHLAIGPAGDALGIDVEGFHREPAVGQRALGCVVGRGVGGGEEAVDVEGGGCRHALIVSGRV